MQHQKANTLETIPDRVSQSMMYNYDPARLESQSQDSYMMQNG